MTNSLMQWHLSRDNQLKLAMFCEKHRISQETSDYYNHDGLEGNYFQQTSYFDNGSFITAECKQGSSLAEDYQVVDYGWATK